jgi:hypothetical protein
MSREPNIVYYPEELVFLGSIFDQAVASIPDAMRTPSNRTMIARSILVQAAAGERDPIKLRQSALMNVSVTAGPEDVDAPRRVPHHAIQSREFRAGDERLQSRRVIGSR